MAADPFERIVALLTEAKASFRVIEHEAEGRSEKISVIRGNRPDQAAKAMVLDVRGGGGGRRHVLAILPGSRKLDFAAVATLFEARKCGFASPDTAQALTGDYRRLNPEDNRERQPIHEHPGAWTGPGRPASELPTALARGASSTGSGK